MKIYTAWVSEDEGEAPWMVAACDESTWEEHGREPDFYRDDKAKAMGEGVVMREITIEVPWEAIATAFAQPVVQGTATATEAE